MRSTTEMSGHQPPGRCKNLDDNNCYKGPLGSTDQEELKPVLVDHLPAGLGGAGQDVRIQRHGDVYRLAGHRVDYRHLDRRAWDTQTAWRSETAQIMAHPRHRATVSEPPLTRLGW